MSDVLPPPPPQRTGGGDSCWKWGAISCAVGCGVLAILIIILIVVSRNFWGRAVKLGTDAVACQQQMESLYRDIERYHKDKSKYPDKLDQLVPTYVPSKDELRFKNNPAGPEFSYYKPGPDSAPTSVMLQYDLEMQVMQGQSVRMPLMVLKNGEFMQGQGQPSGPYRRRPGASPFGGTFGGS